MTDLQHSARQSKALARKKRNKAAMRRARKAKQAHRTPGPTSGRIRARLKTERFEVDQALSWVVVRAEFNRASACAAALRRAGLAVFEARQEERLVAENGKARVAQVPVLRRLIFVGMASPAGVADLERIRFLDAVWALGEASWVWTPRKWVRSARPIWIGPRAMQRFADHITGHLRDDEAVHDVVEALFAKGETVRVVDGAFSDYVGAVREHFERRGRYRIDINMLGGVVSLELDEKQLEAA